MRTHARNPIQIALLLAFALAVPVLSTTVRADDLVMPYSCQMVGGRPLLVSSSPQTYRITGPREQRKITLCSQADPARCRAWNVHSFTMSCGGAEVPWPAVIAGSPPARDGRARLENGRFQLSMPPAWNLPASDPCARQMDAPSQQSDPELERYCADRPDLTQQAAVEMPTGFAPTLGLDVKFNTGNGTVASAPLSTPPPTRRDTALTAQTQNGGLTWKASPVAPAQPGSLQAGVPFDAAAPPQALKKKPPSETKTAARAEPALKPALPPHELPVTARQPAIEPSSDRQLERPTPQSIAPAARVTAPAPPPPVAAIIAPLAASPSAPVTPTPPVPAIKPVEPPAKVAAIPQPEPAPPATPAPTATSQPPLAPPVLPPQTATSDTTKSSQLAESMTKQEPYSSRPQKLTPPN